MRLLRFYALVDCWNQFGTCSSFSGEGRYVGINKLNNIDYILVATLPADECFMKCNKVYKTSRGNFTSIGNFALPQVLILKLNSPVQYYSLCTFNFKIASRGLFQAYFVVYIPSSNVLKENKHFPGKFSQFSFPCFKKWYDSNALKFY